MDTNTMQAPHAPGSLRAEGLILTQMKASAPSESDEAKKRTI